MSSMHTFMAGPWPWWVVGGLGLGLAQAVPWLWPLAPIGVALALRGVGQAQSWRAIVIAGWWIGTLKCLGGYAWIWSAYPLTWLHLDNAALQFFLVGCYWVTAAVFMGAGLILPLVAAYRLWARPYWFMLLVPLAWLGGEVLGSFIVSLWLLGPGGYPHIYIGHGYAGLPWAQLELAFPLMAFGGMYGLTYGVVFVGTVLARLSDRRSAATTGLGLFVIIMMVLWVACPRPQPDAGAAGVIAVETDFTVQSQQSPQGQAWKSREVEVAVRQALQADDLPDLILLPEDSRFTSQFANEQQALDHLKLLAPTAKTVVVDSARTDIGNGQVVLRAYYYDLGAGRVYVTDKQFLVPQGEYLSYAFRFLLRLIGQGALLPAIDQNQNYVPGPLVGYEGFPADVPPILFCSESSLVTGVRQTRLKRASSLILHPISHARFHESAVLTYQLDSLLQTQAVWSSVTIVSATNMSTSRRYGPDGHIKIGEVIAETDNWRLMRY